MNPFSLVLWCLNSIVAFKMSYCSFYCFTVFFLYPNQRVNSFNFSHSIKVIIIQDYDISASVVSTVFIYVAWLRTTFIMIYLALSTIFTETAISTKDTRNTAWDFDFSKKSLETRSCQPFKQLWIRKCCLRKNLTRFWTQSIKKQSLVRLIVLWCFSLTYCFICLQVSMGLKNTQFRSR